MESRLKKWLGSQEPIDKYFRKKVYYFRNYLTTEQTDPARNIVISRYGSSAGPIFDEALAHLNPFTVFTEAEFQQVTDTVFSLNGTVFTGSDVCETLRASTFVFPHIISSGKEIEEYALEETDSMSRRIVRELCRVANTAGRELMIQVLVDKYNITEMLALFPGEPGWELQEGNRIFEMFEKETDEAGIYVTSKGLPNVAYTAFGLMIGN